MMVTAPLSARIADRVGTKITVAVGLGLVTVGLLSMTGLQADTPYIDIFWRLMLMSAGMGLTMAPATESVMGSLPLFKAGVGSAVNDTTRQVGGALGVAVIGSVLATTYGNKVGEFLSGLTDSAVQFTGPQVAAAKNSIGAVQNEIVPGLRSNGFDSLADQISSVANDAFVSAVHRGVIVAALATGLGVLVVLVYLPARARADDVELQDLEFVDEHAADHVID
jgi:MFS family permease